MSRELTPKEAKTLALLADGKRIPQIALELGVKETTVRAHRNRIYLKKGLYADKTAPNVKLAVEEFYRTNPHMVPFAYGDRAHQLGRMSAQEHAVAKILISERRNKINDQHNDSNNN